MNHEIIIYMRRLLDGFLIHAYYTPFFSEIQVFLAKSDFFVNYDNNYVNDVMLIFLIFEQLFLPFSLMVQYLAFVFLPLH